MPDPIVPPPVPTVVPPEPKHVQVSEDDWKKVLAAVEQIGHMPGMVKRLVSETITATPPKAPEIKPEVKREEAWQKELDGFKAQLEAANNRNALQSAVSKVTFYDPEDAVRELLPKVKVKEDGKQYVSGKKVLGGVEVDEEFDLDSAVAQFAKSKPYLVKTVVTGGNGARSGAGGVSDAPRDYKTLYDNPTLMKEWLVKDPALVASLRAKPK